MPTARPATPCVVAVGDSEEQESVVPESGVIAPVTFEIPEDVKGELGALAQCIDADDNTTEVTAEAYILDRTIKANPASFPSGTPTEITAGEFLPGSDVTLRVNTQGDDAETVLVNLDGRRGRRHARGQVRHLPDQPSVRRLRRARELPGR